MASKGRSAAFVLIGRGRPTESKVKILTDTLDFRTLRLGIIATAFIKLVNLGDDPVSVSSIKFSNNSFSTTETFQSVTTVPPGDTGLVRVQYTPADVATEYGIDTLAIGGRMFTSVLKGSGKRFSSLFKYPPYSITVNLTDVFGRQDSTLYSFKFQGEPDAAQSTDRQYTFSHETQTLRAQSNSGFYKWYESGVNEITVILDSSYRIDSMWASYSDSYSDMWEHWHHDESMRLHNVRLQLNGNTFTSEVGSIELPAVIDSLGYDCDAGSSRGERQCVYPEWRDFSGFKTTAKLSITIRVRQ